MGSEMMEQEKMTIHYQYDDLDRLVTVRFPGGRSFWYSYDPSGNLIHIAPGGGSLPVATAAPAPRDPLPSNVCPQCGGNVNPGAKFCGKCGTPLSGMPDITGTLAASCSRCGRPVKVDAKFCPKCGNKLY